MNEEVLLYPGAVFLVGALGNLTICLEAFESHPKTVFILSISIVLMTFAVALLAAGLCWKEKP